MFHPIAGRINQQGDFVLAEHSRQALVLLRKRDRIGQVRSPQRLSEQEPQSCRPSFDGPRRGLAIAKQMNMVATVLVSKRAVVRYHERYP